MLKRNRCLLVMVVFTGLALSCVAFAQQTPAAEIFKLQPELDLRQRKICTPSEMARPRNRNRSGRSDWALD